MSPRALLLEDLLSKAMGEGETERPAGLISLSPVRSLTAEPVYAIPDRVLGAIETRIRGLLSVDELEQERKFSSFCNRFNAVGLQYGQFVRHLTLCGSEPPLITDELARTLGWDGYGTADEILKSLGHGQKLAQPVLDQLEAYVGWLMTNLTFLAERDALRAKWQGAVERLGRIPQFPVSMSLQSAGTVKDDNRDSEELATEFNAFYKRWQLKTLATWDLPEPIGANIGGTSLVGRLIGLEDRPVVQLPPTVKLPVRYPLRDLVHSPLEDHLADWDAVMHERHPSHFNYDRWGRAFRVLFLRNVVLASAYPDRFHRRAGALDWILADYFDDESDESVRKLRLWIQRRLGQSARSSPYRSNPNR